MAQVSMLRCPGQPGVDAWIPQVQFHNIKCRRITHGMLLAQPAAPNHQAQNPALAYDALGSLQIQVCTRLG